MAHYTGIEADMNIHMRCTKKEKRMLRREAKKEGLTMSQYIRSKVFKPLNNNKESHGN